MPNEDSFAAFAAAASHPLFFAPPALTKAQRVEVFEEPAEPGIWSVRAFTCFGEVIKRSFWGPKAEERARAEARSDFELISPETGVP